VGSSGRELGLPTNYRLQAFSLRMLEGSLPHNPHYTALPLHTVPTADSINANRDANIVSLTPPTLNHAKCDPFIAFWLQMLRCGYASPSTVVISGLFTEREITDTGNCPNTTSTTTTQSCTCYSSTLAHRFESQEFKRLPPHGFLVADAESASPPPSPPPQPPPTKPRFYTAPQLRAAYR